MGRIRDHRIGEPFPCQLLVTGQIAQYDDEEDDGYFEKGKAKKYVVLDTGQHSGTVDIVLNAKTHAMSNICVFDKRTGRMWAQEVPRADIGPDNDGKLYYKEAANLENIYRFKDQANAKELGGYSDWRVPNMFELLFLADIELYPHCIDATAFPSPPVDYCWASSTYKGDVAYAYVVKLEYYLVTSRAIKATEKYYCRLVRGPK